MGCQEILNRVSIQPHTDQHRPARWLFVERRQLPQPIFPAWGEGFHVISATSFPPSSANNETLLYDRL